MTILGQCLINKSINKASISCKIGINASRLTRLCRESSSKLTAKELYLISLALDIEPNELLIELYGHLKLEH